MPSHLCFESPTDLKVYQNIWGLEHPAFALEEWLCQKSYIESSEKRLSIAQSFRRTEIPAEQWLPTIEALRLTLILNEEQVRFCFENLPQTKKNKALRDCFFFYLNSPLVQDTAQFLWDQISELQGHTSFLEKETIQFIPSSTSSYIFEEFSKHLPLHSRFSPAVPENPPLPLKWASPIRSLNGLSESIQANSATTSTPCFIHFLGSESHQAYLKYRLASLGLDKNVFIVPLSFTLIPEQSHRGVFCDSTILENKLDSRLLFLAEREQLFYAGFKLPRPDDLRTHAFQTLKDLSSQSELGAFICLPTEHCQDLPLEFIDEAISTTISSSSSSVSPQDSYCAPLGVTYLSATQLETFADCPSKYLFKRLKLDTRVVFLSDFALNFGSAVHLTLETFFSEVSRSVLTTEILFEVFRKSLEQTVPFSEDKKNIFFFYEKAFEKIASRIIALESSLAAHFKPAKTLAVEKDFKIEIDGFPLVGKIDRVDLLSDNTLLILDYKTGSVTFTPDHLAKGKNFQALLYWLGAEKAFGLSPSAMLFYDLKKTEVRRGLANASFISPEAKKHLTRGHSLSSEKLQELLDSGVDKVASLGKQIQQGYFPPQPSSESCRFCDAPLFCRKGLGFE